MVVGSDIKVVWMRATINSIKGWGWQSMNKQSLESNLFLDAFLTSVKQLLDGLVVVNDVVRFIVFSLVLRKS